MNQVLSHLTEEERKIALRCREASTAPWIADTMENLGNNWTICTLGNSQVDGKDHIVTTDHVHASEFNGDAKSDAEFIAAARTDIPTLLSTINALRECVEAAERTIRDVQELLVTRNGISNVAVISAIIDTISGYIPPSPKTEEQSNGK